MKMKKVLAIGLSAAMIMSVTSGTVTADDLDADVAVEEFSDDEESAVVAEETEVEENDSDQAIDVEFQDEDIEAQQLEDDDIALFSDGEDSAVSPGDDSQGITASGQVNESISWTLYDNGELVIDGIGDMPDYEFYTDTPWYANYNYSIIKKLVIGKGITAIGQYDFGNLTNLTDIEFECNDLKKIGRGAFSSCSSLEKIELPDSVEELDTFAFVGCVSLQKVSLSDKLKYIGSGAFQNCKTLVSIKIPDSVTTMDAGVFIDCSSLENVELSKAMTCIESVTFRYCKKLSKIEIPESVTRIGSEAFYGCKTIEEILVPNSVVTIEKNSFAYCSNLQNITLPSDLTTIAQDAFYKCENLQTVRYCGTNEMWSVLQLTEENINNAKLYLGHTEVKDAAVAATCEKDGLTEGSHCSVCNKVLTEQKKVSATGHKFSSWKTTSQATVFSPEKQSRSCSACGKSENREAGSKLQKTMTVTATSLPLKTKQKTTVLKVSGLAAGDSIVSWESSNTKVAKVSGRANGTSTITAGNKKGTAKITITLKSGLQKVVKVTVQKSAVKTKKITGVAKSLKLNKKQKAVLRPVIAPLTSKQKITYKSSNSKVASVNSKGQITAKKKGTAVITVKSGSKTVKCKVTVK